MSPTDVREIPRTPGAGGRGAAFRVPLPVGVYPDAPTALRAILLALPLWVRLLLLVPTFLVGRPPMRRRWGRYTPGVADKLGPLRVVQADPTRVGLQAACAAVRADVAIEVADGAITVTTDFRPDGAAGRIVATVLTRALRRGIRPVMADAAARLIARAPMAAGNVATIARREIATTIVSR